MKKTIIYLIFILTINTTFAQRLSIGINYSNNIFSTINLKENYIFPETSYNMYYIEEPKKTQFLNQHGVGIYTSVDYKRFMIFLEVNLISLKYNYKVYFPSLTTIYNNTKHIKLEVNENVLQLPVFFAYKLLASNKTPILILGMQYNFNLSINEEYFNDSDDTTISLWKGFNELYNITYNFENYYSPIIGIGYINKNFIMSLTYSYRLKNEEYNIDPDFSFLNLKLGYTLTFQKFKNHNYIYYEK